MKVQIDFANPIAFCPIIAEASSPVIISIEDIGDEDCRKIVYDVSYKGQTVYTSKTYQDALLFCKTNGFENIQSIL